MFSTPLQGLLLLAFLLLDMAEESWQRELHFKEKRPENRSAL